MASFPASPQTPPARRKDGVHARAEPTEEQNRQSEEKQTAYLASAFDLPASC
jgi:hypothetical protein